MKLRLFHYWRSSSSWRVRWAFALKKIECEFVPIDLLTEEADSASHLTKNPMGFVPVLEFLDSKGLQLPYSFLGESVAIIEWTEEFRPEPRLLPGDAVQRARIRQLAEMINSGTQPLQNLNVMARHSTDPVEQKNWNRYWIRRGLGAYESLVRETAGRFSVGDNLTMADLFLVPQCYNALRNEVDLGEFPTVKRIQDLALQSESCEASAPDRFKP